MSANDFGNVPQCFQIPATEKPRFFAVRSGTERLAYGLDARTDALCDRSISPIMSSLAVLKADGAFVPLDPSSQSDQWITRRTRYREMVDVARHEDYFANARECYSSFLG